jgi:hypothetical protein
MAEIPIPISDTLEKQEILARLPDRGTIRYEELVDEDSLRTRQALDELELAGEVDRMAIGEHIMLRRGSE